MSKFRHITVSSKYNILMEPMSNFYMVTINFIAHYYPVTYFPHKMRLGCTSFIYYPQFILKYFDYHFSTSYIRIQSIFNHFKSFYNFYKKNIYPYIIYLYKKQNQKRWSFTKIKLKSPWRHLLTRHWRMAGNYAFEGHPFDTYNICDGEPFALILFMYSKVCEDASCKEKGPKANQWFRSVNILLVFNYGIPDMCVHNSCEWRRAVNLRVSPFEFCMIPYRKWGMSCLFYLWIGSSVGFEGWCSSFVDDYLFINR